VGDGSTGDAPGARHGARPVDLQLSLAVDADGRPAGTVGGPAGERPRPFSGWLELMAEISRRVGHAGTTSR
jgi:hypothetical protein